ncbi:ImmA/IrrE family metallo-endopeptidase [Sorangium sp. So ce1014]|uniref:ImmA/IrrE family metallo-endopeptidase n=1 Tax=Sorangium sp. So ce1014 TaxID=3133326 RepID=UPI003F643534
MARRDAILEGTQAAQRLHAKLGTRIAFQGSALSRIDVFRAATELGALLLFRPLSGLLGAYLGPPNFPMPGILVSTQRDLHVQRFTAAHELGHLFMGHTASSLDEQIGLWRGESKDPQEIAADAFASEFMLPRWLYIHHAGRHRWGTQALASPQNVYQLSLRMGASFDATCWGLSGHKILDQRIVDKLRETEPKKIKLAVLAGRAELTNPWADVWIIDEADDGLTFEGGPDDIVVFRCKERPSAGYLWDETRLQQHGLEIIEDYREESDGDELGGELTRVLVTRVRAAGEYRVSFSERRPWHPEDSAAKLSVILDLQGKEQGLPRITREAAAAA